MLQCTNLSKTVHNGHESLTILQDISLSIQATSRVAIVGRSGSGKTTLLGLLAGLDIPTSGHCTLAGNNLSQLSENARAQLRAQHVGFIFQNFQLLPSLSALENVMLPLELAQHPQAKQQASDMLQQVELSHRLHHLPHQLSGGEQQRVAIARAFALSPRILFADEPTGNLDNNTAQHIETLLFSLNKQKNTTLVLVTHDERLAKHCDQHIQLHNGCIVADTLS